jgi:hypothetical protein
MASYIKYWAYPATSVRCLTQAAGLASPSPLRFASPMGFGSSALLFCLCPSRPSAVLHFSLFFFPSYQIGPTLDNSFLSSPSPLHAPPCLLQFNLHHTYWVYHHSSQPAEYRKRPRAPVPLTKANPIPGFPSDHLTPYYYHTTNFNRRKSNTFIRSIAGPRTFYIPRDPAPV